MKLLHLRAPAILGAVVTIVLAATPVASAPVVDVPSHAALGAAAPAAGVDAVPTPTVARRPTTATSHPFTSVVDPRELADHGYVEEELSLAGDAFKYDTPPGADGTRLTGGPNADGSYPYKSRMVVRRPADPGDFNGVVLVEWLNVSAGFDLDTSWGDGPAADLMREGYAWVGVSAQRVGIDFLRGWFRDPTRYADLAAAAGATPGDSDQASYDIFSQAAKAIRGGGAGVDPMGPLDPTMLIASGSSQSAGRLNLYHDSIQNLHGVIDSFLITELDGPLRDDLDAKVIRILSEAETRWGPSSEVDDASYRRWEVAGASHVSEAVGRYWEPLLARDIVASTIRCEAQPLSAVPVGEVRQAALDALVRWQGGGDAPPIAPRMRYDASGELVRDQHGIAQGGIALPETTVPVALDESDNRVAPGVTDPFSLGFCGVFGRHVPFSSAELHDLYADHAAFVAQRHAAVDGVLAQGFITPEGAERLRAEADADARIRPTPPVAAAATGTVAAPVLTWDATAAPDTTYRLDRRPEGSSTWATVIGAATLTEPSFSLDGQRSGTFTYRVRSSTDVPLESYRALSGRIQTTPFSDPSARVTTVVPTALERWTERAYADLLDRGPDPAERNAALDALELGHARWRVAGDLVRHPDARTAQITAAYQEVLGRAPEGTGLAYWEGRLAAGLTRSSLHANLLNSGEVYSRAGATPEGYLARVYEVVLDRPADASGSAHFAAHLRAGTPRWVVARAILGSSEARRLRVTAAYQTYLRRGPDAEGSTYWTGRLAVVDDGAMVAALVGSAEYLADAQIT